MSFPVSIEATTYFGEAYNNLSTTLSQLCGISDTTVYVASTTNFPSIGWFTIEDEIRSYTGKTSGSFTGCTPGSDNTTAAEHAAGKAVSLTFPAIMWTRNIADLRAALTKLGIDASAVTSTHDYKLSGVTGTDKSVSKTGTETLTNKTLTSPLFTGTIDGWTAAAGTFTYASATTITVAAGAASIYQKGDKIKLTQTTVKYFSIVTVADTLLTVTGGSDYTVADAAITLPAYSHVENPLGFPQWFNWTPDYTQAGAMTYTSVTTNVAKFKVSGNACTASFLCGGTTGGTADTTIEFTMPLGPADANLCRVTCYIKDTAEGQVGGVFPTGTSPYTTWNAYRYDGAVWGLGASRNVGLSITYRI